MDEAQVYSFTKEKNTLDHYANQIFQITKVMPTQCYMVNANQNLFIKYPANTNMDYINGADNIRKLEAAGIVPKLTTKEAEENTVFVNSAPGTIFDIDHNQLTKILNEDNKNIIVTNTYVPPKKVPDQKLGSIKITLATRNMVNSIFTYGVRILGCLMEPTNIRQGLYLTTPQCRFCCRFHEGRACERLNPACPNCAERHQRFECPNRGGPWKCINCRGPHKATSNYCPRRMDLMSDRPLGDLNQNTVICPFGEIVQAPTQQPDITSQPVTPQAWINPSETREKIGNIQTRQEQQQYQRPEHQQSQIMTVPAAPLTSYHDCLRMALLFDPWYPSFLLLQPLMGLNRLELPQVLRDNITVQETDVLVPQQIPNTNPVPPRQNPPQVVTQQQQNTNSNQNKWTNPLTGANTVPLPPKEARETKRAPLLPTPRDPYQGKQDGQPPRYNHNGTIPKTTRPPLQKQTNTRPTKAPSTIQQLGHLSDDPDDPDPIADTSSQGKQPLKNIPTEKQTNQKINQQNPQDATIVTKNRFDMLSQIEENTEDNIQSEEEELPTLWTPPKTKTDKETKEEEKTNHPNNAPVPKHEESSRMSKESPPQTQLPTKANDKNQNIKEKPKIKPKPQTTETEKTLKLDLKKYRPAEIPEIDKEKYTNTRNKFEYVENTHPQHLKTRTPPPTRHTLDPNQLRKTMESFHVLSDANEKTARQLYTEVKEAAEHYSDVKREYFKHTTNPLLKNHKMEIQGQLHQELTSQAITPTAPEEDTINRPCQETETGSNVNTDSSVVTFSMGSSESPPPTRRKNNYKHPTPPQETSTSTEEPESPRETSPQPRRLLRSNSTTQHKQ